MNKKFNQRLIAATIAASTLALLSGCGSSSGSSSAPAAGSSVAGGVVGGCVPINTTNVIPFTATGMHVGAPGSGDPMVIGGMIPPGDSNTTAGTFGTMALAAGGQVTQPYGSYGYGGTYQGQRVDGTTVSLTVTSATNAVPVNNSPGLPYNTTIPSTVNATGYIQVSSFIQNLLVQTAMGTTSGFGSPILNTTPGSYPGAYPTANTQICVSNLGISLQHGVGSYSNWLYLGSIYFYLSGGAFASGGQHGLALNF